MIELESNGMRGESIAEVGCSLMLAVITGLYGFGGLAFADYAFLAIRPSLNAAILLLFGLVNLPLCILWTQQTATEIRLLAATRCRRTHSELPAPR